jgi:choline dehydrogenase-like flavoprotein
MSADNLGTSSSISVDKMDTSSSTNLDNTKFDYVIVGGGTSGLVVARRLPENQDTNVLVLEAGANRTDDPRINIPGLAPSTYWNPEFDWALASTPQVRNMFDIQSLNS